MYELRTPRDGRVVRVEVDEGQMVAEDDDIVVLQDDQGWNAVRTDIPGVVRELYVEAGVEVERGAVIALIDES
jgi:acetyl-CoA carboxylase biotin carboxyl carrier protein